MANKKGSSLIIIIMVAALFGTLSALLIKLAHNNLASAQARLRQTQAFYLAEAGLERGKVNISNHANWFTDLPHDPADDSNWLIKGAVGQTEALSEGTFKLVRELNHDLIYAIGYAGKAVVVLKLDFRKEPPQWEII